MSPERRFSRAEKIHLKGEWKGESLLLIAHGKQTQSSGALHDALAKDSRESSQNIFFHPENSDQAAETAAAMINLDDFKF